MINYILVSTTFGIAEQQKLYHLCFDFLYSLSLFFTNIFTRKHGYAFRYEYEYGYSGVFFYYIFLYIIKHIFLNICELKNKYG
jgi:hypothetical protein